jgi:hypothetical protein
MATRGLGMCRKKQKGEVRRKGNCSILSPAGIRDQYNALSKRGKTKEKEAYCYMVQLRKSRVEMGSCCIAWKMMALEELSI